MRFAWFVVGATVAVIVWGAFVRATGSGAGCGAHWPLCNGEVVPRSPALETLVELSHRVTSGLSVALVVALALVAFRTVPRGHPARGTALAAVGFILVEALIGAMLVLLRFVADDPRPARAIVLGVHLTNTFLLLGSLALAARWLAEPARRGWPLRRGPALTHGGLALAGVTAVAVAGGVTALGDTLFPASSLPAGVMADWSPTAHVLLRLRVWHPVLAVVVGLGLCAYAEAMRRDGGPRLSYAARRLEALVGAQLFLGTVNLVLLAPTALQLLHLLLADLVWIALVVLVADAADVAVEVSTPAAKIGARSPLVS